MSSQERASLSALPKESRSHRQHGRSGRAANPQSDGKGSQTPPHPPRSRSGRDQLVGLGGLAPDPTARQSSAAPGKSHRQGITLIELTRLFPDEDAARTWFEAQVWPNGRACPHCGSVRTHEASHAKSPYRCSDCRHYFSVKTGTALEASKIPLRLWAFAIYLEVTSLKGVSSMKLHRDLGVTQKTAWFMLHRIRESWAQETAGPLDGPLEADEMYVGGKHKNKPKAQRPKLGRGKRAKREQVIVAGVKDRATNRVHASPVASNDWETLTAYVRRYATRDTAVYTDEYLSYRNVTDRHDTVKHSQDEYVRGDVHTQGIESFWSLFKRGYVGTYHRMSPKHLHRYLAEFTGRHGIREQDTIDQMRSVCAGLVGRRLLYRELIA